jgi:hypothetical protein
LFPELLNRRDQFDLAHGDAGPIDGPNEHGLQDALVVVNPGRWRRLVCLGAGWGSDNG